jgi:hypothetical protein
MSDRKKIDGHKYLLVFLLTAIIFIAGISIGNYFSSVKINELKDLQESFRTDTLDLEVQFSLIEKDPCNYINSSLTTQKLYDLSSKLEYMENTLGKNDAEVIKLKNYYQLLELRQWLFEKTIIEKCQENKSLILYFYSNVPEECPSCEKQGFILSYLKKDYQDKLEVFSFDYNIQSESIQTIKRKYGITMTPTIIIDGNKYENFQSTEQLKSHLELTGNFK